MSEVGEAGSRDAVTAGALLRAAREAAGLHVAMLAANLKVPVRKLEALENDRYEELPDAVFIRALASSVCRTLKTDPQPILDRLPQTVQVRLAQDRDGINTPFRATGRGPKPGSLHQVSRPVALTVLALLLAAVAVVFLPVTGDDPAPTTPPAAQSSEPVMPPGSPPVTSAPAEPRAADPLASANPPLIPSTSLAPAPAAGQVAAAAAAAASAPIGAVPSTAGATGPIRASGLVTFRTRGSSWIQVTDASGTPVFRRLMQAGETAGASGSLPLAVTIGSVEQTEVLVRGKPYNLEPVSRDNVARFEVK